MARWLNMVEVTCVNPVQTKEFLTWYENIHLSDILGTSGYLSGRLYEMKEFRDGRGQFLTLYDIETDQIDKTIALRREKRERERAQRHHRVVFTVVWLDVLWRLITERTSEKAVSHKGERWINLV